MLQYCPKSCGFCDGKKYEIQVGYSVLDCKFCSKWLKVDGLLSFLLNFENLHLIIYLLFNSDVIGLTTIMSTQRPTRIETTSTTATPDLEGKKLITCLLFYIQNIVNTRKFMLKYCPMQVLWFLWR